MSEVSIDAKQMAALQQAIKQNPQLVRREARNFLVRGLAVFKAGIFRSPWRIGAGSGGAPVASGTLMRTHKTEIGDFEASIGPDPKNKYAEYVHRGTKFMEARPWLDYVQESSMPEIEKLELDLLNKVVNGLAS